MERKAFCSFMVVNSNTNLLYRVRMNVVAGKAFRNAVGAIITKTDNYIIFTPVMNESELYKKPNAIRLYRGGGRDAGIVYFSFNGLVRSEGFINKHLFGKRYKIKRDKQGRIYVCLKEVITDDGQETE